ncbi:hypothetical protein SSP35_14_00640 [Streptomyces sp. NBRC 110611]|uniref:hypothetical protein n=1 Tax=Streptomyces sp. NBRC 110611 TaxID=1621259 RepID=UPI00085573BF|nr:hypothetical protein [Streptomyces sp. NBRC 110611]GAU69730.1 hypothetical protein SSP35_14_00640 [Streptomyces sp. NBRC 110611]
MDQSDVTGVGKPENEPGGRTSPETTGKPEAVTDPPPTPAPEPGDGTAGPPHPASADRPKQDPSQLADELVGDEELEDWEDDDESDGASSRTIQRIGTNNGTVIGNLYQTVSRLVQARTLTSEWIDECLVGFVEPKNISAMRKKLDEHRIVVLVGDRGVGRYTTAVHLLHEHQELRPRQVRREPNDSFTLVEQLKDQRGAWLLDLRSEEQKVGEDFGQNLLADKAILEESQSILVVAVRPNLWEIAGRGADDLAVHLEYPEATAIVRARLEKQQPIVPAGEWLTDEEIVKKLGGRKPDDAVRWANAIRAEHFAPVLEEDLKEVDGKQLSRTQIKINNVLEALGSWRTHLRTWHIENPDSDRRNFLLAAALLEGSPVGDIFEAAASLSQKLKDVTNHRGGQSGPGIIELAWSIGATLTRQDTLRFQRPDYADAVLEYFWVDRMPLTDIVVPWMANLPVTYPEHAERITNRLGQYVLRYSAHHKSLKLLQDVATQWSSHNSLKDHARDLITAGALHPVIGRAMRDRMKKWAQDEKGKFTEDLKVAVARACGGPLADEYPKMMLYRLSFLAAAPSGKIAEAVGESMQRLWHQPNVRGQVRSNLSTWCASDDPALREAGRRSFMALAQERNTSGIPLLLSSATGGEITPSDQALFIGGWRSGLDSSPLDETSASAFKLWMDTALQMPSLRGPVVDIFTRAVHDPAADRGQYIADRFLRLTHFAYNWSPVVLPDPQDGRSTLRESLLASAREADPAHQLRTPYTES